MTSTPILKNEIDRRQFLQFLGRTGVALSLAKFSSGCVTGQELLAQKPDQFKGLGSLTGLPASAKDELIFVDGLKAQVFLRWGDAINSKGEKFGCNNDYIALLPIAEKPGHYYLWVNHEYNTPVFTSGHVPSVQLRKTFEQAAIERTQVGGSLLEIQQLADGSWQLVSDSSINRRYSAETVIPFSNQTKVFGASQAVGTLANCAGGVTPWGTFLSCEENFHQVYGSVEYKGGVRTWSESRQLELAWTPHFAEPPEHFGWVVEIDPKSFKAEKLVSLGRFSHEGATCVTAKDGRCVVYMGDDKVDEHFYKFISDKPRDLTQGTLYVASLEEQKWKAISLKKSPALRQVTSDPVELMVRTREAAKFLRATPLDRPEDCEIDPFTNAIYLCCTANPKAGRPFGSILKIVEKDNDFLSMDFESEVFQLGGAQTGYACPDNLVFDKKGNLWITTDMPDEDMNQGEFKAFGNNALIYIAMSGPQAGVPVRMATAPVDAELTGPQFSPDYKTLFLAVQHPGGSTVDPLKPTSNWPDGGMPKSAVVTISGPLLDQLMS